MKKEKAAILEMLICAALWSVAGIFIKLIPWNGFVVAGMRSGISALTIGAYMLYKHRRLHVCRRTVVSGIYTSLMYVCFVVSNKLTTAANAIVLQFTCPVFIVIFSFFFLKKKIKKADLITVIITMCGIALFFFDQLKPGYLLGNFIAIGAGMAMAGMYVTVGDMEENDRFSSIILGQIFTFLIGLPFAIATRPEFTGTAIINILILGVFQLGISYVLFVEASKHCPPLACSLLGALEPLLNPVWVFIFNGEHPGIFALIGGIIVIVTITVWTAAGLKHKEPEGAKG